MLPFSRSNSSHNGATAPVPSPEQRVARHHRRLEGLREPGDPARDGFEERCTGKYWGNRTLCTLKGSVSIFMAVFLQDKGAQKGIEFTTPKQ